MPSPFPGMDPYIERSELWPDFHDRFITYLCAALKPLLRPRYAALTQDRLYVTKSERPIYPDVGIHRTTSKNKKPPSSGVATLEPDDPVLFEISEDTREPYIEIIEPALGNQVIAAIEVPSPSNKTPGDGRESYIQKRNELWAAKVHVVEIDLLREGETTVNATKKQLEFLTPWHYIAVVHRRSPPRQEFYPFPIQNRLPRISIPLATGDADVTLDLQAVFSRCWDEGPYPDLLRYSEDPPGTWTKEEIAWCRSLVA